VAPRRVAPRERLTGPVRPPAPVTTLGTGLLPQAMGGHGAQLTVGNRSTYYDPWYMHPQDVAAVSWLYGKVGTGSDGSEFEGSFVDGDLVSYRHLTAPLQRTQTLVYNDGGTEIC